MPIEVIRTGGQDVPPSASDPTSDAYLDWLTRSREEFLWRQGLRERDLLREYLDILGVSTKSNTKT